MDGSKCGKCGTSRLSPCGLGMGLGVTSAIGVLVLGLLAKVAHVGVPWVSMVASLYVGFAATPLGIAIGMGWAFLDGFIFGIIIACVYNLTVKYCPCKRCKPEEDKKA